MAWPVIARHEARHTLGSQSVKLLLGILAIVCVLAGYVYPLFGQEPYTTAHFGGYVGPLMATVVPLIGLVIGYNAIVSERDSGALFLTLSLPHTRSDVVFGKVVGRAAIVVAGVVLGLLVAGALVVYPFGELEPVRFLGLVVLTVVLAIIYTGIGIAISMAVGSKQIATIAAFGVYFLFVLIWSDIERGLALGLDAAGIVEGSLPDPVTFLFAIEPAASYQRAIAGFVDPTGTTPDAWYLGEWVAIVLLALWLVVPLGLALRRFSGVDL